MPGHVGNQDTAAVFRQADDIVIVAAYLAEKYTRATAEKPLLKARGGGVVERGCADASLYRRMEEAGLNVVRMLPQMAASPITDAWAQEMAESTLAGLTGADADEWRAAGCCCEQNSNCKCEAMPDHTSDVAVPLDRRIRYDRWF